MTDTPTRPRVRFAPSPTGRLHIGGARTAIFNWAYAKAKGGTFILRIEDTDPERSTEENVRVIVDALRWLGLDWDEGPEVGGVHGPYFQTARMNTYRAALETLKEAGAVYPCFCTKDQLDAKRAAAEHDEGGYAGYDRTCRAIPHDEASARIAAGEAHVWRLKVPDGHAPIEFTDEVYGPMSFPAEVMDDMIVVRSDGSPTYNFAVVCDDANMGITHVIRGDDHLSNTPRQILIYEALGAAVPTFAHLSMILGPDGHKLSKRHGATSVEEYRDRGYLPDAMVNFLALLGWSKDGETTILSRDELCVAFDLDRITKKDAIFDETKLDWMNGVYIREMGAKAWVDAAGSWLARAVAAGRAIEPGAHIEEDALCTDRRTACAHTPEEGNAAHGAHGDAPDSVDASEKTDGEVGMCDTAEDEALESARSFVHENACELERLYPLVSERLTRLDQIPEKLAFLYWGPHVALDAKSVKKVLLKESARPREALSVCRAVLADEGMPWECDALQSTCRARGEERGIKPRNLFQPLRVAVCGNMVSPPLFESIELLKRADVLARIDGTIDAVYGE